MTSNIYSATFVGQYIVLDEMRMTYAIRVMWVTNKLQMVCRAYTSYSMLASALSPICVQTEYDNKDLREKVVKYRPRLRKVRSVPECTKVKSSLYSTPGWADMSSQSGCGFQVSEALRRSSVDLISARPQHRGNSPATRPETNNTRKMYELFSCFQIDVIRCPVSVYSSAWADIQLLCVA